MSFLQDRKIVAQGLTDERGMFAVQGLTPWGVYSVTASSQDYVCMFASGHSALRSRQRSFGTLRARKSGLA